MNKLELQSYNVSELSKQEIEETHGGEIIALIVIFVIGLLVGYGLHEK